MWNDFQITTNTPLIFVIQEKLINGQQRYWSTLLVRVSMTHGHPDQQGTPVPLLSVDEFFLDNEYEGSIGCNLEVIPHPREFFKLLKNIQDRSDVMDIRIQITAFDVPEWPFTDTIYIMTMATEAEVESWFPEHLKPDDVWEGFVDQEYEPYDVPTGSRPVAAWWD